VSAILRRGRCSTPIRYYLPCRHRAARRVAAARRDPSSPLARCAVRIPSRRPDGIRHFRL